MMNTIQNVLSGLVASSKKIEANASNIANADTAGSLEEGKQAPYAPVDIVDTTTANGGVKSEAIPRPSPFVPSYEPDSPFADDEGIIGMPNVNLDEELTGSLVAKNSYQANLSVFKTVQEMQDTLLDAIDRDA